VLLYGNPLSGNCYKVRLLLVGSAFSIADIALYAYTHVAPEGGFDLAPLPAVRAWIDRVAAQPGHVAIDD
jgi:glutathione S-transferase